MLSLVVTTYDRATLLAAQLDAVAKQRWDGDWEVVVVDNGESPDTPIVVELAASRIRNLRYVHSREGRGPAYSRNVGARQAGGEFLAFLDEDDEVAAGWLPAIASALERHTVVAAQIDVDALNPPWLVAARGRPQATELMEIYGTKYRFAAAGTMAIRRAVHEAVGGFDETMPPVEDVDYCIRLADAGHSLHFAHDAVVRYRFRSSFGELFRQSRWYGAGTVRLYSRYPRLPRPELWGIRTWGSLLKRAATARDRAGAAALVWQTGNAIGFAQGSVQNRTLLLGL